MPAKRLYDDDFKLRALRMFDQAVADGASKNAAVHEVCALLDVKFNTMRDWVRYRSKLESTTTPQRPAADFSSTIGGCASRDREVAAGQSDFEGCCCFFRPGLSSTAN